MKMAPCESHTLQGSGATELALEYLSSLINAVSARLQSVSGATVPLERQIALVEEGRYVHGFLLALRYCMDDVAQCNSIDFSHPGFASIISTVVQTATQCSMLALQVIAEHDAVEQEQGQGQKDGKASSGSGENLLTMGNDDSACSRGPVNPNCTLTRPKVDCRGHPHFGGGQQQEW